MLLYRELVAMATSYIKNNLIFEMFVPKNIYSHTWFNVILALEAEI